MQNKVLKAVIDVGSNSSILVIGHSLPDGSVIVDLQKVHTCRLGDDLHGDCVISDERMAELANILQMYRQTAHNLGANLHAVVLTEAVRKAQNQQAIVNMVKKSVWMDPCIISGETEAQLAWYAMHSVYGDVVSVDIGGGSTELGNGEQFVSFEVGALKMMRQFGPNPGAELETQLADIFTQDKLEPFMQKPLVFASGTATSLAMLMQQLPAFALPAVEGFAFTLADIQQLLERLTAMPDSVKAQLPGLEGGRHEIIICGIRIIRFIIQSLQQEQARVSTYGMRYGVLQKKEFLCD
jgi:exopolyphosphatase / guanosine-5'-triphosphate,3'-diphosphate pyrophosphatase